MPAAVRAPAYVGRDGYPPRGAPDDRPFAARPLRLPLAAGDAGGGSGQRPAGPVWTSPRARRGRRRRVRERAAAGAPGRAARGARGGRAARAGQPRALARARLLLDAGAGACAGAPAGHWGGERGARRADPATAGCSARARRHGCARRGRRSPHRAPAPGSLGSGGRSRADGSAARVAGDGPRGLEATCRAGAREAGT